MFGLQRQSGLLGKVEAPGAVVYCRVAGAGTGGTRGERRTHARAFGSSWREREEQKGRRVRDCLARVAPSQNHLSKSGEDPAESEDEGRVAFVERKTKETSVFVKINIDGTGKCDCSSGVPFLDHMLDQIASHGLFDLEVKAEGDLWIDDHHTTEDIALAFGQCLSRALGTRAGIHRFGDFSAPLDEALVHVVLDLSGRPHLGCDLDIPTERIGTFQTEMVEHFFQSLSNTSGMTLHIRQLAGKNAHHIVEASFKAFARALRQACSYDPRRKGMIASSKGVLTQN
mmetsp:Transcript_9002/g.16767  ORF Transcript_9002/g.16767 Transcript_9002/m.16767 type:complete len:285 (+) Transcript_9002:71-925(+)